MQIRAITMNLRVYVEQVGNCIHSWIGSNLSAAGFSRSSVWNTQLVFRDLSTGAFWYIAAIAASIYAALLPSSIISGYIQKGADQTLGPILWNIVATAGLIGFGLILIAPGVALISKWSRHVLLSAFVSGCLMLGTLTFRYFTLLDNPGGELGAQYWMMVVLAGVLLIVCYVLNLMILYLATLIHPSAAFMMSLKRLTPSLRIGSGILVLTAVAVGMAGASF
jgi:hypothetical protein